MSGPRDWSPYDATSRSYQASAHRVRSGSREGTALGWGGLLVGIGALVIAVVPIVTSTPRASSYLFSSIGIFAIILGTRAIARGRSIWSRRLRGLGWTAVVTGATATILMLAQAVSVSFGGGVIGTPAPYAAQPVTSDVSVSQEEPATLPVEQAPVQNPGLQYAQVLGTISYTLRASQTPDGMWPEQLGIGSNGGVFVALPYPETRTLAILPSETDFSYWVSYDRLSYGMRLSARNDPSVFAVYESATDAVSVG
jgi:hypothetical protein